MLMKMRIGVMLNILLKACKTYPWIFYNLIGNLDHQNLIQELCMVSSQNFKINTTVFVDIDIDACKIELDGPYILVG